MTTHEEKYIVVYAKQATSQGVVVSSDIKSYCFFVEQDAKGYFYSELNVEAAKTYNDAAPLLDENVLYTNITTYNLPYKYFMIKKKRLCEIPESLLETNKEL